MFIAGDPALATDIFIAASSRDADAFRQLYPSRYHTTVYFLITGHVPEKHHAEFLQPYTQNRKLHFLFSKDDTGALCDLKLASWIRNKPLKITYTDHHYFIEFEQKTYMLERLSLNALEKASRYNFRIRTHKPKNANTFYEQLRNRHPT